MTTRAGVTVVVGTVQGVLPGQTQAGESDAFVARLDSTGKVELVRQFGTPARDGANRVLLTEDAMWLVGATAGALGEPGHLGLGDGFAQKRRLADGAVVWTTQFGTANDESALAAALDAAGNLYVAAKTTQASENDSTGAASDVLLHKLSPDGALLWSRRLAAEQHDAPQQLRFMNDALLLLSWHEVPTSEEDAFAIDKSFQSLVTLNPENGAFASGIRLSQREDDPLAVLLNGEQKQLTPWASTPVNDFITLGRADWILAGRTSGYRERGTCPSHDGPDPYVQRLRALPSLARLWAQPALVEPTLINMFASESVSVTESFGEAFYELGTTRSYESVEDVYARKLGVKRGEVGWQTRISGQARDGLRVAASGDVVMLGWTAATGEDDYEFTESNDFPRFIVIERLDAANGRRLGATTLAAE